MTILAEFLYDQSVTTMHGTTRFVQWKWLQVSEHNQRVTTNLEKFVFSEKLKVIRESVGKCQNLEENMYF